MTPDEVFGSIDDLVPRPVPARYLLLHEPERHMRARASIALWLLGLPPRSAWLFALSNDPQWEDFMRDGLTHETDDRLYVLVLRRRLSALARRDEATSGPFGYTSG